MDYYGNLYIKQESSKKLEFLDFQQVFLFWNLVHGTENDRRKNCFWKICTESWDIGQNIPKYVDLVFRFGSRKYRGVFLWQHLYIKYHDKWLSINVDTHILALYEGFVVWSQHLWTEGGVCHRGSHCQNLWHCEPQWFFFPGHSRRMVSSQKAANGLENGCIHEFVTAFGFNTCQSPQK